MSDYAPFLENAFRTAPVEDAYEIEEIEGEIPSFIRGTYYVNGPAFVSRDGFRYRHWLDGDGMVCALRFDPGRLHFTNRFVHSTKFLVEEAARRPVFRAFGTRFPGDRLKRGLATESPINVSVYPYRGTLLTFGENSLPCELDPITLDSRGPFTFGGQLNEVSPFAAHPKFHPTTGELFNFGVSFSAREPCLHLYRFDTAGSLRYRQRIPLPYPCSVHDFSLTPRYAVFYLSPYLLDLAGLLREGRTTLECLRWEPQRGSRLLVVDCATGEEATLVPVGCRYCLHLINAYEDGNRLVVDAIEFERPLYDQYEPLPHLFTDESPGWPARLVVDLAGRTLFERRGIHYPLAPDFPSIDPIRAGRPYEQFWMLGISAAGRQGRKFFDQLVLADWRRRQPVSVYQAPPLHYLAGEPVFVGDAEDPKAAVVLCQLFGAAKAVSRFVLFDAFDPAAGPVATIRLRSPIPLGFHATFQDRQHGGIHDA